MDEVLKVVAESCKADERLMDIVKHVASMSDEDKEEFERKVKKYFLRKQTPEDLEAYRFFCVVLESDNAKMILELIGRR